MEGRFISIITPTFNSSGVIERLIASLRGQTDLDFEWIIADGGSVDSTLDLVSSVLDLNVRIVSEPDFGIYDAMNKGIRISRGDYYIVVGSDDVLYNYSIEEFKKNIDDVSDIFSARVHYGDRELSKSNIGSWYSGAWKYVSCHSVGTLFKKDLHDRFGWYSNKFPIVADQYFIKRACLFGAVVKELDFVSGRFGDEGLSSSDILGVICDFYHMQIKTGELKIIQTILLFLRIVKNIRRF